MKRTDPQIEKEETRKDSRCQTELRKFNLQALSEAIQAVERSACVLDTVLQWAQSELQNVMDELDKGGNRELGCIRVSEVINRLIHLREAAAMQLQLDGLNDIQDKIRGSCC